MFAPRSGSGVGAFFVPVSTGTPPESRRAPTHHPRERSLEGATPERHRKPITQNERPGGMTSDSVSELLGTEIAIVAAAGRFPGAPNVDRLWENLRDGVE